MVKQAPSVKANDTVQTLDIIEFYRKYIAPLSKYRGENYLPSKGEITKSGFYSRGTNTIIPILGITEPLCHTFYRMVGFPIVDKDGNYFSPGTNIDNADLDKAVLICNNFFESEAYKASQKRIDYQQQLDKIFQKNEIGVSVLLLSIYLSKISGLFDNLEPDPLNPNIDSQKYTPNYQITNNDKSFNMLAFYYKNKSATAFNDLAISTFTPQHIIRPFVVDPRFNCSVEDSKAFKFPFAAKSSQDSTILEDTCLIRLKNQAAPSTQSQTQAVSSTDPKNTSIENQIESTWFDPKVADIVKKYSEYCTKVNDAIKKYHFLPSASKTITDAFILKPISSIDEFNSAYEADIVKLTAKIALKSIDAAQEDLRRLTTSNTNPVTNTVVRKPEVNAPVIVAASGATSPQVTTQPTQTDDDVLKRFVEERKKICIDAINAIQAIEYITGYISGFGIIDYICIIGALYLVDTDALVGLLDETARKNLSKVEGVTVPTPLGIKESLNKFNQKVKYLYNKFDEEFKKLGK